MVTLKVAPFIGLKNIPHAPVVLDDVLVETVKGIPPRGRCALDVLGSLAVELAALKDTDDHVLAQVREVDGKLMAAAVAGVRPILGIARNIGHAKHIRI